MWRLVDGPKFINLKTVLDNVMQERATLNIGITKRQAMVIAYESKEYLWNSRFLGEDMPDQLCNTLFTWYECLALCYCRAL